MKDMNKTQMRIREDNRGIALISVIIISLVCALIASIVLEITYSSLLSRKVFNKASAQDYISEGAVDDMEAVIQNLAYYSVNKNSNTMGKTFIEVASSTLASVSGANLDKGTDATEMNKVAEYLYQNLSEKYRKVFSKKDDGTYGTDASGNYIRNAERFKVNSVNKDITSDTGKLAISVTFSYENENGFLTVISTDLVMNDVTQRKAASDYSLGSYSMFNGGGAQFINGSGNQISNKKMSYMVQEGNVYIGTMQSKAPTALIVESTAVEFTSAVICNGDVWVKNNAALILSGGKSDTGARTEVTINGTVYIDKNSVLVINDEIDFVCKDIIIVDGSNQYSAFDGSKNSYAVYNNGKTYASYFPFNATNTSKIHNGSNQTYDGDSENIGYLYQDFIYGRTGGCVMIRHNDKAYVADYNGTKWVLKGDGAPGSTSALINKSDSCVPEALTTIRTYDNKEVVVDAEMARFVNIALLYMQNSTVSNAGLIYNSARYINKDAGEITIQKNVDLGLGGASVDTLYTVGGKKTSDLSYGTETSSFSLTDPITINGNSYSKYSFKIGKTNDTGVDLKVTENGVNEILIAALWDHYQVQSNGGNYVGITICSDYCSYNTNGQGFVVAYSILNAKEDASESEGTQLTNFMKDLKYITFIRDSGLVRNNGYFKINNVDCFDNAYALSMLTNLFVGGMDAFVSDSSGAAGGSVTLDKQNMYDFITVENWQQN